MQPFSPDSSAVGNVYGELVEIALKRSFSDGTYAVQLDPLSLLCRLVAAVPPPKFHTVRHAGVLIIPSN